MSYHDSVIRVAYHTLGCKVNQYETEKIRESLESAGFTTVPFSSSADAYVINTCSVTSVADGKSRAAVRRALRANPNAFVVVAGCYAQLDPDAVRAIDGIDLIVSNDEKQTIAQKIIAGFANSEKHTDNIFQENTSGRPRMRTRAVVKVQDGCDQFCSYCIVPHARSRMQSRPIEDVIAELRVLAGFGYKEIVLTGIRLGSYKSKDALCLQRAQGERSCQSNLPELIRAVASVGEIERIRLSSIEPWEVDDALLDAMKSANACRHLHIPLQSGDDDTLARMNRPYTSERYREIISHVQAAIPNIGITTDVIVGFPGETEEAFENTRALIEQVGFSRLHVFRYSIRPNTPAASMTGQVSSEVKKRRAEKLIELGKIAMRRFAKSMIGQTVDVLVENRSKQTNYLTGFTDNYIEVSFAGDAALSGQIVPVTIVGLDQDIVTAKQVR